MKKIRYVVITVVLGALGSAFWEIGIKPLFNFLYEKVLLIFQTYNDSLYWGVSTSSESTNFLASYFIISALAISFFLPMCNFRKFYNKYKDTKMFMAVKMTALASGVVMLYIVLKLSFSYTLATRMYYGIETVAPFVTDIEYKKLKSDYYLINSKQDYDTLESEINKIATKNGLKTE